MPSPEVQAAGRVCPTRYRYRPAHFASLPEQAADTLYVVGGLYGNEFALDALDRLVGLESGRARVMFNGDFHWFDVDGASFERIDGRVAEHLAIVGNVEAELCTGDSDAGCGCAYPASVDTATVDRSNAIFARLKATARTFSPVLARLSSLPMTARVRVADVPVAIAHGDAESLAGWHFDVASLDDPSEDAWRSSAFDEAGVGIFATSHTCLPALRSFGRGARTRVVINNGAAGMPNFRGTHYGVVTRIGRSAPPLRPLYGTVLSGLRVEALPLHFDCARWQDRFLHDWAPGSAAHVSYWSRIVRGPDYDLSRAAGAAFRADPQGAARSVSVPGAAVAGVSLRGPTTP